jgi:hypothetical protein
VAALTKVSIAPTEPLSETAAKLAFKVDVLGPVCFATLNAALKRSSGTFTTHQLFWLELLLFLLRSNTIFLAAKVCIFTFEALIVGQFVHGKLLKIAFEVLCGVF